MEEATEVERLNKVITAKNEKIADLEMKLRKVLVRVERIKGFSSRIEIIMKEIERE